MPRRVADGPEIRRFRELACLPQYSLAEQIGISAGALSQIEAGGGMKLDNIKRAAGILKVPVTDITVMVHEPAEVCTTLGITRQRLKRLVAAGELVMRAGGITEQSLEEYIAARLPAVAS